jgi:hypothetical protein
MLVCTVSKAAVYSVHVHNSLLAGNLLMAKISKNYRGIAWRLRTKMDGLARTPLPSSVAQMEMDTQSSCTDRCSVQSQWA